MSARRPNLTDLFDCTEPRGKARISYRACLLRQAARTYHRATKTRPILNTYCALLCSTGRKVKAMFPDWTPERTMPRGYRNEACDVCGSLHIGCAQTQQHKQALHEKGREAEERIKEQAQASIVERHARAISAATSKGGSIPDWTRYDDGALAETAQSALAEIERRFRVLQEAREALGQGRACLSATKKEAAA